VAGEATRTTGEFPVVECANPAVCDRRFAELERRVTALESDEFKREIWNAVNTIRESVANLNGRMAGYLLAGGLLGAVVAILAQFVMAKR
jgi:hypothetical protein